jgi:hypothetical protein
MEAQAKAPEQSLLKRLVSTETALCCVGIGCMVYGVVNGLKVMPLFFGLCIVGGSVMLHFVRKKDWDAHWSEMDRIRREHELRMADEQAKEKKD